MFCLSCIYRLAFGCLRAHACVQPQSLNEIAYAVHVSDDFSINRCVEDMVRSTRKSFSPPPEECLFCVQRRQIWFNSFVGELKSVIWMPN